MREKIKSKFSFSDIKKLKEKFEHKKWTELEEFDYFFQDYCNFLEKLNSEQSNLINELTEDFLWLNDTQYLTHTKKMLEKLLNSESINFDSSTIYICPLVAKKDRQKTKSSHAVAYNFRNTRLKFNVKLKNTHFKIIDLPKNLPRKTKLDETKNIILLVDDFIGTGETAKEAIEEIVELKNYTSNNLIIGSLICQTSGKKLINDLGFQVISSYYRKKGLDDRYDGEVLKEKTKIMDSIEEILKEDSSFQFEKFKHGYGHSQALVSLIRTPNNTFPIYWFNAKLSTGKYLNAPFPR